MLGKWERMSGGQRVGEDTGGAEGSVGVRKAVLPMAQFALFCRFLLMFLPLIPDYCLHFWLIKSVSLDREFIGNVSFYFWGQTCFLQFPVKVLTTGVFISPF